ncbi:MAG: glycosyltransferase family 4 protein [Acutalibacteraceae bacterium]|nr:glycosyltransferase family 4 protein [Acutalibacteraceae bacterium]
MKKILFVATITEHFYYFHLPYLKMFHDLGWQVDVASHGDVELPFCDNRYEIPIKRSPADKDNLKAYFMLKKIIKNNYYDIVHCHTPMGGILARLASFSQRKNGTKVLYTAHGFHFYEGAPKANWMVYFPIEFVMSMITDCLITINDEDYKCAKKNLKAKKVAKVNGVGYNSDRYFPVSKEEKFSLREKLGYKKNEKLLIYVAEMNLNKNQAMLIRALNEVLKTHKNVRLIIAGADNFNGEYPRLAKELGIEANVDFLGHREDIDDLLHASDIAVGSSYREGLPVNVMEALACGLPVVLSDNRGHRVLGVNGENGYIININDYKTMAQRICEILEDDVLYERLSDNAIKLIKPFSKESVLLELKEIYSQYIN